MVCLLICQPKEWDCHELNSFSMIFGLRLLPFPSQPTKHHKKRLMPRWFAKQHQNMKTIDQPINRRNVEVTGNWTVTRAVPVPGTRYKCTIFPRIAVHQLQLQHGYRVRMMSRCHPLTRRMYCRSFRDSGMSLTRPGFSRFHFLYANSRTPLKASNSDADNLVGHCREHECGLSPNHVRFQWKRSYSDSKKNTCKCKCKCLYNIDIFQNLINTF